MSGNLEKIKNFHLKDEASASLQEFNPKISWDHKAQEFIAKKQIKFVKFSVEIIEEPCTQIFSPEVEVIKSDANQNSAKITSKIQNHVLEVEITEEFFKYFRKSVNIMVSVEGLLKKKLYLKNIEPIIINTCKN